jgi:hypothetical protein
MQKYSEELYGCVPWGCGSPEYVAPNAVMFSGQQMGKNLEGINRGLICGIIPYIFMTEPRKITINFSQDSRSPGHEV